MTQRTGGAEPLFSFAVLGDTHVNPDATRSASPWRTNVLANRRAEAVVAQINRLAPAFVVHLGDMVHPVPFTDGYDRAAAEFWRIFEALEAPLHLVPGNHDVGDKPTPWTPAAHVSDDALDAYRVHFGDDRYAFDHGGFRFVVVNDEILNTGSDAERRQWDWLEGELAGDRRTFLFTHYPPFLQSPGEIEHYDNLAEPARSRLCAMLGDRVEAVFCGHVHNFFYNRIGTADCYVLPATSAVRHDYTEMFVVPPPADAEHGRDSRSKLGFFLVDVFEDGHVAHFIRSHGETDAAAAARSVRRPSACLRGPAASPLGVDMRIGWADVQSIPFSGAVDELNRKPVRNDYIALALWELGIGRLRLPLNDLVDPLYAGRVADLAARGHRLCVFGFELPAADLWPVLRAHAGHIEALELICRGGELGRVAEGAARLRRDIGVPVFLSRLRVSADAEHKHQKFAHFIRHGFDPADADLPGALELVSRHGLDGPVFSVPREGDFAAGLQSIDALVSAAGQRALVQVHLAVDDPAAEDTDEHAALVRVAEAAVLAWRCGGRLSAWLDTFSDHDRGYFPRTGLVDRRYDPRPAGQVLKSLIAWRCGARPQEAELFGAPAAGHGAVLVGSGETVAVGEDHAGDWTGRARGYRIDTGEAVAVEAVPAAGAVRIAGAGVAGGTPLLILLEAP